MDVRGNEVDDFGKFSDIIIYCLDPACSFQHLP
jgi:hypothetical protein